MSFTVNASNYKEWERLGLGEIELDMAEFVNQEEDGFDQLRGEWYIIPEEPLPNNDRVIYHGTFGNDNSPGASHYTYAEVYNMDDLDDAVQFETDKAEWEAKEEYAEGAFDRFDCECGNCGEMYTDEGEPWHERGYCSQHCLNKSKGDECGEECQECEDDEVD
jgi:hypothetical protein